MSARDAAHSLASLQRLFNQTNLIVVTPSAPTFSAQDLHLHSPHDLKARLKVKSSDEPPNRTRRPPPERYPFPKVDRSKCRTLQHGKAPTFRPANGKNPRAGAGMRWN